MLIDIPTEERGGWRVEAEFIAAVQTGKIQHTDFACRAYGTWNSPEAALLPRATQSAGRSAAEKPGVTDVWPHGHAG